MGEKRQKGKGKKRLRKYHHTGEEDMRWLKAVESLTRKPRRKPMK